MEKRESGRVIDQKMDMVLIGFHLRDREPVFAGNLGHEKLHLVAKMHEQAFSIFANEDQMGHVQILAVVL